MTVIKPTGKRGIAYIRTSKEVQQKARQHEIINRWATEVGVKITQWIDDSGSRDLSHKRDGWQELQKLVESGRVDWVVIAERDRLGFADAYEYGKKICMFRDGGVELWCCNDGKLLTGSTDRLEPILASLVADKSQTEQSDSAGRIQTAKRSRVERGQWSGGKPPYGYDLVAYDDDGQMVYRLVYEPGPHKRFAHYANGTTKRYDGKDNVPGRDKGVVYRIEKTLDPVIEGHVKQMFKWFLDGMNYHKIATTLNAAKVPALYKLRWLSPTVQAILMNPCYVTGTSVYNKSAQGRFAEWVGGKMITVPRVNGKAKKDRQRTDADHITSAPRPENAIIDRATWDAVQKRIKALAASPKTERRARNPELYLSGLVVCGQCGERMVGWAQQKAYRCSTNQQQTTACLCHRSRHDILEELTLLYLEQTKQSLEFLYANADHCLEVVELERQSEPLIREYVKRITAMWQAAKSGASPSTKEIVVWTHQKLVELNSPATKKKANTLAAEIADKELEKTRLAKRLGLVDDDAAAAITARMNEVAAELRDLRQQAKPLNDEMDAIRNQLKTILEQTKWTRESMAKALPLQKGEYIRRVIARIVVHHKPVQCGTQRRSELVGVEIVPLAGQAKLYSSPSDFTEEKVRAPG